MNILYTAISNNYDELHDVKLEPGWRAICFTDGDIKSDTWEIQKIEFKEKVFRDIKIRPHVWLPGHEKSVWIDGNLEITIPLSEFVKNKDGFWLMTHPDRNCIYEEAIRCIELRKDDPDIIHQQIRTYVNAGYPANFGLSATGCIIRDVDCDLLFGEHWGREVRIHSIRDQLSFDFVRWCRPTMKVCHFPFLENIKYHYHEHKKRELEQRRLSKIKKKKARITKEYYRKYT